MAGEGHFVVTVDDILTARRRGRERPWDRAEAERAMQSRSRCALCPHFTNDPSTGFVKVNSRGSEDPLIVVVGESPGIDESREGVAFIGKAGRHGARIMEFSGIDMERVRWCNLVNCFAHNPDLSPRPPKPAEILTCSPYLYEEIHKYQPKVIMTFGSVPTNVILGDGRRVVPSISSIAGETFEIRIRGRKYLVVPSIHPAADLRRDGSWTRAIEKACRAAWSHVTSTKIDVECRVINDTKEAIGYLKGLLKQHAEGGLKAVAVDLEWDAVVGRGESRSEADRMSGFEVYDPEKKIVIASFATCAEEGVSVVLDHVESKVDSEKVLPWIKRVVETIPIITHNYPKAEGPWLIKKIGAKPNLKDDTMFLSFAKSMRTRAHGLKGLCVAEYEGWSDWGAPVDVWFNSQMDSAKRSHRYVPLEKEGAYAPIDAAGTYALWVDYTADLDELAEEGKNYWPSYNRRLQLCQKIIDWELEGNRVDLEFLSYLEEEYPRRAQEILDRLRAYPEVQAWEKDHEEWVEKEVTNEEGKKSVKRVLKERKKWRPRAPEHVGDVLYSYFGAPIIEMNPALERNERRDDAVIIAPIKAGAEIIPDTFAVNKGITQIWLGPLTGQVGAERAKIDAVTPRGVTLKKPLRFAHESFTPFHRGSPSTNEKTIDNLRRRIQCDKCRGSCVVSVDGKELECPSCAGTGGEFGRESLAKFLYDFRLLRKILTAITGPVGLKKVRKFLVPDPKTGEDTDHVLVNYLLHTVRTGRLSTKDIPIHSAADASDIRRLFVSRWRKVGGLLCAADYSQLELRVLASISGDQDMINVYLTCPECRHVGTMADNGVCTKCRSHLGLDLHRQTAAFVLGIPEDKVTDTQRSAIKATVFGILYGRGEHAVSAETGLKVEEAASFKKGIFQRFPGVKDFVGKVHAICQAAYDEVLREYGGEKPPAVRFKESPWFGEMISATGTRLVFEGKGKTADAALAAAKRESQNYPIQGSAGEMMIDAIIRTDDELREKNLMSVPWETTHDSEGVDTFPGELFEVLGIVKDVMEVQIPKLHSWVKVPLVADMEFGVRWDGSLSVKKIEGNTLHVKGMKEFYEETTAALAMSYNVSEEVIEIKNKPMGREDVIKKGYKGGSGRIDHIEAILTLEPL